MTSQNNILTHERGSSLIVTMLLVSVLLMTALILLQRIVPYAKSVRSMHDASLAYYLARGEIDLGRHNFLYSGVIPNSPSGKRGDIFERNSGATVADDQVLFTTSVGASTDDPKTPVIAVPTAGSHIVVSTNDQAPLQIKLFSTDSEPKKFGTSRVNPGSHTLYSRNAGGLRFDLRGVDLSANTFTLKLAPTSALPVYNLATNPWNITLKMEYRDSGVNAPLSTYTVQYPGNLFFYTSRIFTQAVLTAVNSTATGNIQLISNTGAVSSEAGITLNNFLRTGGALLGPGINCTNAQICSLTLILSSSSSSYIDFQLISSNGYRIPDLNAVVVGDGISGNGLYYQRIIDLIPTPQDI